MARAVKGPVPVEKKIIYYRPAKPKRIRKVFIQLQFFLTDPGNGKIDYHTAQANNSEFYDTGIEDSAHAV